RGRVGEAAAAHPGTAEHDDVLERRQAQQALETQAWSEDMARELPRRLGQLLISEAAPGLEHRDAVALLGQAQRRDAAAKAGADDQPVRVESTIHAEPRLFSHAAQSRKRRGAGPVIAANSAVRRACIADDRRNAPTDRRRRARCADWWHADFSI